MIAKVIVDIPSKSVDFKFDYIVPKNLERVIQIGAVSYTHLTLPTNREE